MRWCKRLVTDTRAIPRVRGQDKPKLFCTPEEIRRWKGERDTCSAYLSYVQKCRSAPKPGVLPPSSKLEGRKLLSSPKSKAGMPATPPSSKLGMLPSSKPEAEMMPPSSEPQVGGLLPSSKPKTGVPAKPSSSDPRDAAIQA